jgi:hypothetical protein
LTQIQAIPNLRGMLFGFGSIVLAVMWVIFIIQVLVTDGVWGTPL